ncbi:hypothetical protein CC80DRAFT_29760 [Byssothecium circinans]|uniref:Uncharacterized protein n=1 Tax=Byssothecium circinans TaxID=147558 RepID=A0A6A5U0D9_9PLEO|nr:hypothetical protein CC80DRAFT_29760 [Byssothecium circinans]
MRDRGKLWAAATFIAVEGMVIARMRATVMVMVRAVGVWSQLGRHYCLPFSPCCYAEGEQAHNTATPIFSSHSHVLSVCRHLTKAKQLQSRSRFDIITACTFLGLFFFSISCHLCSSRRLLCYSQDTLTAIIQRLPMHPQMLKHRSCQDRGV